MKPEELLKWKSIWLLVILLAFPAAGRCQQSAVKSNQTVPRYRCLRPLTTEPVKDPALAVLRLDASIWEQTRDGLPDLLLSDEGGLDVPFLVRPAMQTQSVKALRRWSAEQTELRPQANGSLEIVVHLKKDDPQPEGLTLFTPLTNFELRLQIHAGTDSSGPLLAENALLYDYTQFMNVRSTTVKFNSGSSRSFCLVIDQEVAAAESTLKELTRTFAAGTETQRTESVVQERRPIRIDRIEFSTESAVTEQQVAMLDQWSPESPDVQQNAETRETLVEFAAGRRPLSQVTLQTSSRNFNRTVHLEYHIPGKPDRWQTVSSSQLRQIAIGRVQETQLTLECPPERHDRWRLRIENGDSPPLQAPGLELRGSASELIWLAEPDRHFVLLYGDDTASAPRHNLKVLETALAAGEKPFPATAGVVEFRTVVPPAEPIRPQELINNPVLLTGLAVLLTAAMGWGLYRAAVRLKELPDEPQHGS
ncbi:MAG: DUF3999 family protein [Planctomycetota bacterium]